ncbi:hypothetical protein T492DRAFT_902333 [Pavlovales sp. CCMP2436]|nr:hypothetical protein T492DRAFT_902333 [Pavlovales sp. CCMP2436]
MAAALALALSATLLEEGIAQVFREKPSNPTLFLAQWLLERARAEGADVGADELPDAAPLVERFNALSAELRAARAENAGLEADLERAVEAKTSSEVALVDEEARAQAGVLKAHADAQLDISSTIAAAQAVVEQVVREAAHEERRAEILARSLQKHSVALELLHLTEPALEQLVAEHNLADAPPSSNGEEPAVAATDAAVTVAVETAVTVAAETAAIEAVDAAATVASGVSEIAALVDDAPAAEEAVVEPVLSEGGAE